MNFFKFINVFFILLGELRTQLQDSGAKFLVTMPEIIDKVKEAMKQTTIQVAFNFFFYTMNCESIKL